MSHLVIQWANKHNMVDEQSPMRTSSDIPVVRLDELQRWLEFNESQIEDNGLHVCIDTLLEQLARRRMG